MRRRSRTRWVLKWIGTAACALALCTWGLSTFWHVGYGTRIWVLALKGGHVRLSVCGWPTGPQMPSEYYEGCQALPHGFYWGPYSWKWPDNLGLTLPAGRTFRLRVNWPTAADLHWMTVPSWWVRLPMWTASLPCALLTALLWWLDRRCIPPGHCQRCGYDLTGNVSGRCPECGAWT